MEMRCSDSEVLVRVQVELEATLKAALTVWVGSRCWWCSGFIALLMMLVWCDQVEKRRCRHTVYCGIRKVPRWDENGCWF